MQIWWNKIYFWEWNYTKGVKQKRLSDPNEILPATQFILSDLHHCFFLINQLFYSKQIIKYILLLDNE